MAIAIAIACGGIAAVVTTASLHDASADEPSAPRARVRLEVDAKCSDEEDTWRRIRARTQRIERASNGPSDIVRLEVRDKPGAGRGAEGIARIARTGSTEAPAERRVEGASCDEVMNVLGLVVAVTYDRDALHGGDAGDSSDAPTDADLADSQPDAAPAATMDAGTNTVDVLAPAIDAGVPEPDRFRWSAGAQGVIAGIDAVPLGVSVFSDVSRRRPSVGFRFGVTFQTMTVPGTFLSARFVWTLLTAEACPVRYAVGRFAVVPCAGVAFGLLDGEPRGLPDTRSFLRGWVAPRVLARGTFVLGSRVALEAQAALEVPLIRDEFMVAGQRAFRAPVMFPTFGFGIVFGIDPFAP